MEWTTLLNTQSSDWNEYSPQITDDPWNMTQSEYFCPEYDDPQPALQNNPTSASLDEHLSKHMQQTSSAIETAKRTFEQFNQSSTQPVNVSPAKRYRPSPFYETLLSNAADRVDDSMQTTLKTSAPLPMLSQDHNPPNITYTALPTQIPGINPFIIPPPTTFYKLEMHPNTTTNTLASDCVPTLPNHKSTRPTSVKKTSKPLTEEQKQQRREADAQRKQRLSSRITELEQENLELRKLFDDRTLLQNEKMALQQVVAQQNCRITELEQQYSNTQNERTYAAQCARQSQDLNRKIFTVLGRILNVLEPKI